ncbi:MAG: GNAT family N-acetyltransferase [Pseudomonadota bacterium]
MIPVVTTDRLTLRAPEQRDFETYAAFRASDRAKTVGGPFPRSHAFQSFCAIIGHWTMRGYGRWIVADKTTDEPVGLVGIFYPEDWPEPEVAWSMFANGEGKGYACEAAKAAREWAYETLGWNRLVSMVDPTNTRSVALAKRLGCTPGGTFTHETLGELHYWVHPGPEAAR